MKKYINAKIDRHNETAFAVEDGRFLKIGTNEEILALDGQGETEDLKGAFVVPGWIDSHMHLSFYGYYLSSLQLAGCRSIDELREAVRRRARETPEGEWITGGGYNEELFEEVIEPTRAMLDEAAPNHPVAIMRSCAHVMIANTKALEAAGYRAGMESDGVHFETGRLEEGASFKVQQARPKITAEDLMKYIRIGAETANRFGITSVGSDDLIMLTENWKLPMDAFMKLDYKGELSVRVNEQCQFRKLDDFVSFLDEGYTTGIGTGKFTVGPLKMILDGSLGGRTAAMTEPYADAPEEKGLLNYEPEELEKWVMLANRFNMPTIAHAIGDRALDEILDVYENAVLPGNPLGYGIVHCQMMRPDQIVKTIALKLNCYFQSLFIDDDAPIYKKRVGEKLASSSYPFRTLYEGTCACNGSDAPVEVPNPLKGIQLAVTRRSITNPDSTMDEKECLTVEQAIDSYTVQGAAAFGMADELGKIKEGYLADFTVLNRDITACPVDEIAETEVVLTVSAGIEVYRAQQEV